MRCFLSWWLSPWVDLQVGNQLRPGGLCRFGIAAESIMNCYEVAGRCGDRRGPAGQSRALRSRSALPITLTELNDIAAAANAGVSSSPAIGYRTPAASGTPSAL